jgi:hypothetical protein
MSLLGLSHSSLALKPAMMRFSSKEMNFQLLSSDVVIF